MQNGLNISFDYGTKGYRLALTRNSSTATITPIQTDLGTSKPFTVGYNTEFSDWTEHPGHISIWGWLSGALGVLLTGLITAVIVWQYKAKKKALLRQASSLSIPLHHRSGGNEVTHTVGVTTTLYGEDASDELPVYTLRVSSPPLPKGILLLPPQQLNRPILRPSSSLSLSSQLPEPRDQRPVYTSDSARVIDIDTPLVSSTGSPKVPFVAERSI